jgi:hypothetical protein
MNVSNRAGAATSSPTATQPATPRFQTGNRPGAEQTASHLAAAQESVGLAIGTFKQLEDSRESTASRAATAENIFDRSTWPPE